MHHLAAALPGLPPRKAPGYLSHQLRQQRGPGLIGYRESSGCHVVVVSHKPIMIAAAASLPIAIQQLGMARQEQATTWPSGSLRTRPGADAVPSRSSSAAPVPRVLVHELLERGNGNDDWRKRTEFVAHVPRLVAVGGIAQHGARRCADHRGVALG